MIFSTSGGHKGPVATVELSLPSGNVPGVEYAEEMHRKESAIIDKAEQSALEGSQDSESGGEARARYDNERGVLARVEQDGGDVAAAQARVDKAHRFLQSIQDANAAKSAKRIQIQQVAKSITRFLGANRAKTFSDYPVKVPNAATLPSVRSQIAERNKLKTEYANALPPLAQTLKLMVGQMNLDKGRAPNAYIERVVIPQSRGREVIHYFPRLQFPTQQVKNAALINENGDFPETVDARALYITAHYDELLAKFTADLEAKYADKLSLSDDDRKEKLEAVAAEILDLERIECALIWRAYESGEGDLDFRADCSPLAVLGISIS